MNNDKPISNHKQDALSRERFIEASVHQIENMDDGSCFIVGLYGKWGTGKTSIVNLIREKLKTQGYFTAYFNPWIFRSEDTLLIELFNTIIRGCNSDERLKSRLSEIGATLKKYSEFIRIPRMNVFGVEIDASETIQAGVKGISTILHEEPSLEEQKETTNQVLKDLANPLIIFIDDVDRLDKEEVRLLFKTIKLTADFDKIIYVLAFDEEIVSKSLGGFYGSGKEEDGKRFIEKIVQLPIRIPELNTETKLHYSLTLLNTWETKNTTTLPSIDREAFTDKFRIIHNLFLETPRDSKRLINAFSFVERSLRGEVNPFDLVLIESLRLFIPKLFQLLVKNSEWLFNSIGKKDVNISSDIDPQEVPPEKQGGITAILDWLFPYHKLVFTQWSKSNHNLSLDFFESEDYLGQRKKYLTKNLNIGSRPYFLKYIEFNIGPDQIPDVLFKEVLISLNTKQFKELELDIAKISSFSPDIIYRKFEVFEQELNEIGKSNFVKILFFNDIFSDSFDFIRNFSGYSRNTFSILTKSIGFFREPSNTLLVQETFANIVQNSMYLQAITQLIRSLESGFEARGKDGQVSLISITNLDVRSIKTSFVERVVQISTEKYFINPDNFKNWGLFNLLEEEGKLDFLKENIQNWIKENSNNALLLIKSLAPMISTGGDIFYSNQINDENFIGLERYADRTLLTKSLCDVFEDIDLSYGPADSFGYLDKRDANESVTVQYLRFVEREENNN